MTLLMVLAPASGAIVHPIVLTPVYKNTTNSPNQYVSVYGCAKASALLSKWTPTTGSITGMTAASAKTCGKSIRGVGGSGSGYAGDGVSVAIPFKVASNGNHAVSVSLAATLASSQTFVMSTCPAFNVVYPPALNSYENAYCEAGTSLSWYANAQTVDLTNSSWYGNYSYADSYNDTYFQNYTYCYNYGTPTCYNSSGTFSYAYTYGYNAGGISTFTLNGGNALTMWVNGTGMLKTHKYAVIISISLSSGAYAQVYNTVGPWAASASAKINMATLGNGASVSSITIA